MTVHTYHQDSHTFGLADGCPRCHEHTERPELSLDRTNIRRLLAGRIYTHNDALAAERLRRLRFAGRYLDEIWEQEQ